MSNKPKVAGLEQYAPSWSLKAAGALLVLTLALNNVGINFAPVMQAWTAKIASEIESNKDDLESCKASLIDSSDLDSRLKVVESLAHKAKGK